MPLPCSGKKRYPTYDLVEEVRQEYEERVPLQFGKLNSYWCKHHEAWHLGHFRAGLWRKRKAIENKGTNKRYRKNKDD